MALVIYDLDDTLLNEDASRLWLQFIGDRGHACRETLLQEEARLDALYKQGKLDMCDYLLMQLGPHIGQKLDTVCAEIDSFISEYVMPHVRPAALENIREHQAKGDRCLVISASTAFLVKPIAKRLGINDAIGVEIELDNGMITGRPDGVISYQGGKVTRLEEWLQKEQEALNDSWFYSDSRNDLPLLELVCNPVAVSADQHLRAVARERNWRQVDWHF